MKVLIVLVFLSLAVMIGLVFQVVTQEIKLHNIKAHLVLEEKLVKNKEAEVREIEKKRKDMEDELSNAFAHVNDLKVKNEKTEKVLMSFEEKLQNCNKDKDDSMMKKATVEANIVKIKGEQENAKARVTAEIDKLKQQILQRDKEFCPFADLSKVEARTLCGIVKAESA